MMCHANPSTPNTEDISYKGTDFGAKNRLIFETDFFLLPVPLIGLGSGMW